ncbi:MAG: hypothetical protein ABIQ02_02170 [Saprospiraceae bacterium]
MMKQSFKTQPLKEYFTTLYIFLAFVLCLSCAKKHSLTTLNSADCKFSAGLVELSRDDEAEFKKQIAAFNQQYAIYVKGETGNVINPNPFFQVSYYLTSETDAEPNISIARLSQPGDTCGLMIGFAKPYETGNILTLYIILTNQKLTRINDDSCKVEYNYVLENNAPVCFSYNTMGERWTGLDKTIIDRWVANLYDTDPAHAPAYKGYYIHHSFGKASTMNDNFYVGLKQGAGRDTLNLFSMDKLVEEIETKSPDGQKVKDIKFHYTHLRGSITNQGISTTFRCSYTDHKESVRPCPPHCAN